jgi:uncharacterized protein involved in exopolysaccharide biosynthesis
METAIQALNDYVQVHAADRPDELAADSRFISLSADASTRTDAYLSVLARYDEAQQARLGVDPLASAVVRVIDPPTIKPFTFSYKSPAVKAALYAGAAIGALELALVYLLARRDPRLRSGEEIAHRFRIRFLGSIRAARA